MTKQQFSCFGFQQEGMGMLKLRLGKAPNFNSELELLRSWQ